MPYIQICSKLINVTCFLLWRSGKYGKSILSRQYFETQMLITVQRVKWKFTDAVDCIIAGDAHIFVREVPIWEHMQYAGSEFRLQIGKAWRMKTREFHTSHNLSHFSHIFLAVSDNVLWC